MKKIVILLFVIILCGYSTETGRSIYREKSIDNGSDVKEETNETTPTTVFTIEFSEFLKELEPIVKRIDPINAYSVDHNIKCDISSNDKLKNIYDYWYKRSLRVNNNSIKKEDQALYDIIKFYLFNNLKYQNNNSLILELMYLDHPIYKSINSLLVFELNNIEDINFYFSIIEELSHTINQETANIQTRDYKNIYANKEIINSIIEKLNVFIEYKSYNENFTNKINNIEGLEDKESYITKNNNLITDNLINPLIKLVDSLNYVVNNETLVIKNLSEYEGGNDLYQSLAYLNTSSIDDVDTIFLNITEHYLDLKDELKALATSNNQVFIDKNNYHYTMIDYESTMDSIKEHGSELYPKYDNYSYQGSYTKSGNGDSVQYLNDNINHNNKDIFKIDKNYVLNDSLETYYSLAYNGYVGKLYLNNYYKNNNINALTRYIEFKGTNNSIATYNALNTYDYIIKNKELSNVIALEKELDIMLLSIIDIGVNYYGWLESDTNKYLEKIGVHDSFIDSYVNKYTNIVKLDPATSLSYSYGLVLYNYMYKQMKDNNISDLEFNTFLVNNYNKPLFMIQDDFNKYDFSSTLGE